MPVMPNGKDTPAMPPPQTNGWSGVAPLPRYEAEALEQFAAPAMRAVTDADGELFNRLIVCQREWLDFVRKRWLESARLPARLAACRSAGEMQQVYTAYWHTALDQYQTEFKTLTQLSQPRIIERAGAASPAATSEPSPRHNQS
jgi:hypothetical protein